MTPVKLKGANIMRLNSGSMPSASVTVEGWFTNNRSGFVAFLGNEGRIVCSMNCLSALSAAGGLELQQVAQ